MSFQFDTLHVTHQITTGIGYPYCLGLDEKVIRGSVYLDGPTIIGDDTTFKTVEGSVMIGPCNNTDSPSPKVCDGTTFYSRWSINPCGESGVGNEKGSRLYDPYSLVVRSGPHLTRNVSCSTDGAGPGETITTSSKSAALFIGDVDIHGTVRINERLSVGQKADFNGDVVVRRDVVVGGSVNANGDIVASGNIVSQCGGHVLSAKKNFDIPHPSKEGWRLTHSCIEGPEAAVYYRGRVRNAKEIDLPSYWKDLVDITTITVSLTPVGSHQDVIVKRWDEDKIYLQAKGGMPVDCFYHIYAERKDTEKLIPEYKGTIEDYPGDNSQRSISGYHYDIKES